MYDIDGNDRLYQVGFREYFNHHSLQADVHDYDGNKQYICVCVCVELGSQGQFLLSQKLAVQSPNLCDLF